MTTYALRTLDTVAEVEALLASPEPFSQWLREHDQQHDLVGVCGNPAACPLHTFLSESGLDNYYVNVGKRDVEFMAATADDFHSRLRKVDLPDWAKAFVGFVDARYAGQRVLASECLAILGEVVGG